MSFAQFDAWVKLWPNARNYYVFADVTDSFAGARAGTPEFAARVGEWAKGLSDHMQSLSLKPAQLGMLLVDEPRSDEQAETIAAWARAIKAAAPEITLWEDPLWERPDQVKLQDSITLIDTLCPNLIFYHRGGPEVERYFEGLRAAGHTLWFYTCDGPVRGFDPDLYYRRMAWHAFAHNAVGIGFWAFGDTGGAVSSWNDYTTQRPSFTPVFISPDGVTDGIHWQAVREGVEDYEYLAMLRDAAARTRDPELKRKAEDLLTTATAAITSRDHWDYAWRPYTEHAQIDEFRLRVLAMIELME
jgi:hypothetical protein